VEASLNASETWRFAPLTGGWHVSHEDERALVAAAQARDPVARRRLVEGFMPLIGSVARGYRSSAAVERDELLQDGVVGLLSALERFDPERGTPFWPYASWWVRQAMQGLVAQSSSAVVLSDRALRQLARVKTARRELLQAESSEPSSAELASTTGLELEHVERLLAAERSPRALDEAPPRDPEASTGAGELADPRSEDDYERVVAQLAGEELKELPGGLSRRERMIICSRYGLGRPPETLRAVAERVGLSAERVRQIEKVALEKLRCVADARERPSPRRCRTALVRIEHRKRVAALPGPAPLQGGGRQPRNEQTEGGPAPMTTFMPIADVHVTATGVTVHMDVPGVRAEQIDVSLEGDRLIVSGARPYPYEDDRGTRTARRVERGFGDFVRELHVPEGLRPDAVTATLVDGVLAIRVPKQPGA
jgi:RNA polymerase sigma factor (sigma-70 family)